MNKLKILKIEVYQIYFVWEVIKQTQTNDLHPIKKQLFKPTLHHFIWQPASGKHYLLVCEFNFWLEDELISGDLMYHLVIKANKSALLIWNMMGTDLECSYPSASCITVLMMAALINWMW